MTKMQKIFKLAKNNKTSAGYTLLELIIASTFGVLVIGAAGFGVMNMLKGNQKTTAQVDRRTEINRGMEFVANEIRKAETIELDPTTAFEEAKSKFSLSAGNDAKPILALNIPDVDGDPDEDGTREAFPIIYYLSSPKSGEVWQGQVLYRHGPPIDSSGNYTTGNWQQEALIDKISGDTIAPNCNGWNLSPKDNVKGFYACIDSDGKTAEIFAVSEIGNGETYKANTKTYARADRNPLDPSLTIATYKFKCEQTTGGALNCSGGSGTMKVITVANLFGCDKYNHNWTTTPSVYVGGTKQTLSSNEVSLSSGDNEIYFIGETDKYSCSSSDDYTSQGMQNNDNVVSKYTSNSLDGKYHPWATRLLQDGDTLPGINSWNGEEVSTGDEHESLKMQLKNYTRQDGTKIVENGVITLKPNEYLLAFEIGQIDEIINKAPAFSPDSDPTTDDVGDYLKAHPIPETTDEVTAVGLPPGADWQDLVVLITLPE